MKSLKNLIFTVLVLLTVSSINAQVAVGVKAGAHFSDNSISGFVPGLTPDPEVLPGYTFGVMAEIPIEGNFSFRPEINYVQKGFRVSESISPELLGIPIPIGGRVDTRINFLEMPLLLQYRYGNEKAGIYALAGPGIGYAANAHLQPFATVIVTVRLPKVDINLNDDNYNRFEFSGHAGLGGDISAGKGKVFADVRYSYGFTNTLNDPIIDTQLRNRGFTISAGYAMKF